MQTPRHDYTLTRNKSFRRRVRLVDDSSPWDLAGAVVTLFVSPWEGESFALEVDGPAGQRLIVEPETELTAELAPGALEMAVADATLISKKGFAQVGAETIEYGARPLTTRLTKLKRGAAGTTPATHSIGATVRALGQVMIYMSDEVINGFTWRGADFRFHLEDSQGDQYPQFMGVMRFEKLRA